MVCRRLWYTSPHGTGARPVKTDLGMEGLPDWPRYLGRAEAARYLGVSPATFDTEVAAGTWPAPVRRGALKTKLTWDRKALDAAADRLSGIPAPSPGARPTPPDDTVLDEEWDRRIERHARPPSATAGKTRKA